MDSVNNILPTHATAPTYTCNEMIQSTVIDKFIVIIDLKNRASLMSKNETSTSFERFQTDLLETVLVEEGALTTRSKHLHDLGRDFRHRISIPIPQTQVKRKAGHQKAFMTIGAGPTRESHQCSPVRIAFNPAHINTKFGWQFIAEIIKTLNHRFQLDVHPERMRIKQLDIALDLKPHLITPLNCGIIWLGMTKAEIHEKQGFLTHTCGDKNGEKFIRFYDRRYLLKALDRGSDPQPRIEFARRWKGRDGPTLAQLGETVDKMVAELLSNLVLLPTAGSARARHSSPHLNAYTYKIKDRVAAPTAIDEIIDEHCPPASDSPRAMERPRRKMRHSLRYRLDQNELRLYLEQLKQHRSYKRLLKLRSQLESLKHQRVCPTGQSFSEVVVSD